MEAEYEADEEESDRHEDETTKTTPAPPGLSGDSSYEESNSESDRPRSPPPTTKPRKATRRNFEREKGTEEYIWESLTGVLAPRRTTSDSKNALKGIKLDSPETLDGDDTKWKNSQRFDGWVNALQRFLAFHDIDLNDRNALEFIGFKVTNSAQVFYNQFQREEQEKDQTFFQFMLALRKFQIPSTSKDLLWKAWVTITPKKDGKNMWVYRFARALDDMQSELIVKQERMRRIREKACLWCGLAVHNYKDCRKRLNKEPMRTAAQEMQLQQPVGKTRSQEKTKQKPQEAIRESLDPNRGFVKVNGHPALALIALQTIGRDLISAQFVYLYKLPVVKIEAKT